MTTDNMANVPDFSVSILDPRTGQIDPTWYQFFLKLLDRTGGTIGTNSQNNLSLVHALQALLNSQSAVNQSNKLAGQFQIESAIAPIPTKPQPADLQGIIWAHGVQNDPQLHAQVTTSSDGFMLASDKSKLDGITGGAAVASVTGTAPITSSGGSSPAIGISAATALAAGSMSSADKAILDAMTSGGTWTPTLSCATPGNLAITYGSRVGTYTKIGRLVTLNFLIATSAFTWTTASGSLSISGLPFTSSGSGPGASPGALDWGGVTKAGATQVTCGIGNSSASLYLIGNGSGSSRSFVTIADTPSGGSVVLAGQISYFV